MTDLNSRPCFLTNVQAAGYLNLSPRTLEKLRLVGGGPIYRKFGRRVLYAVADLEAWAGARKHSSTTEETFSRRV